MVDISLPLERHHFVHVQPAAWSRMLARCPEFRDEPLVSSWVDRGWPVIARRPVCGDLRNGHVPLGLALPASHGRRHLMLNLPVEDLLRVDPPPLLRDAALVAPDGWGIVLAGAVAIDPDVRCYGSLAWQCLTGLLYVAEDSDLDLLWHPASAAAADALSAQIERLDDRARMRIDGEFLTPSGLAVRWREWLSSSDELVVKTNEWVSLMGRQDIFA